MDSIIGAVAGTLAFLLILWLQQAWIERLKRDCKRLEKERDKAIEALGKNGEHISR
jgi:hypothetical protein